MYRGLKWHGCRKGICRRYGIWNRSALYPWLQQWRKIISLVGIIIGGFVAVFQLVICIDALMALLCAFLLHCGEIPHTRSKHTNVHTRTHQQRQTSHNRLLHTFVHAHISPPRLVACETLLRKHLLCIANLSPFTNFSTKLPREFELHGLHSQETRGARTISAFSCQSLGRRTDKFARRPFVPHDG
jgi:hypothetical protein